MKEMTIDKTALKNALDKIGFFVGKMQIDTNVSCVHFKNKDKKAVFFAHDHHKAGRVFIDTDEEGEFEFVLDYSRFQKPLHMRGKSITIKLVENYVNDEGVFINGIEFTDGRTRECFGLNDSNAFAAPEMVSVVPDGESGLVMDAKHLKEGFEAGGCARNEKEKQKIEFTGIKVMYSPDDLFVFSTDQKRISCWQSSEGFFDKAMEAFDNGDESIKNGLLSPEAIHAVSLFDDNETVSMYDDGKKNIFVSESMQMFIEKINGSMDSRAQLFRDKILASNTIAVYEAKRSEFLESLKIVKNDSDIITVKFKDGLASFEGVDRKFSEKVNDDGFPVHCIEGEAIDITISPSMFIDTFSNITDEMIKFSIKKVDDILMAICYSTENGSFGCFAPRKSGN